MSRKRRHISNGEAQRRLCAIVALLREDVQLAVATEATIEKGNEILSALSDKDRKFWGAQSYDLIASSLAYQLAIVLARLFDRGAKWRHANTKTIASIPLMHRLLKQARCRKYFANKQHPWFSEAPSLAHQFPKRCEAAIDDTLSHYRFGITQPKVGGALKRLKYFRDNRLAHSIFDAHDDTRPTYSDLFLLINFARNVLKPAIYAIEGAQYNFGAIEDFWASEADRFWRKALPTALKRLERSSS